MKKPLIFKNNTTIGWELLSFFYQLLIFLGDCSQLFFKRKSINNSISFKEIACKEQVGVDKKNAEKQNKDEPVLRMQISYRWNAV